MIVDVSALKTAIPYIKAFKNKIFVIKFSGDLCEHEGSLNNVAEQVSLLYQLGIKVVLVHGGGKQATSLAKQLDVPTRFVNGRRVTSEEMLEVTKMSFVGVANTNVLSALLKHDIPAVGISGIDGGLIKAKKRPPVEVYNKETGEDEIVDYGMVGDVVSVNPGMIHSLLDNKYVPVVASLAADENGEVLNVNGDTMASTLAGELQAMKYCLLTNIDGVMSDRTDPTTLFSELNLTEVQSLIESEKISGGMVPKLSTCLDALKRGVARVHIVNGLSPDALLQELFTNEGCGTLITAGGTS